MELRHNGVSGNKFGFGLGCVLYIMAYLYFINRIIFFANLNVCSETVAVLRLATPCNVSVCTHSTQLCQATLQADMTTTKV